MFFFSLSLQRERITVNYMGIRDGGLNGILSVVFHNVAKIS